MVHELLAERVESGIELPPPRLGPGACRRKPGQLRRDVEHFLVFRAQLVRLGYQPRCLGGDLIKETLVLFVPEMLHERRMQMMKLVGQLIAGRVVSGQEVMDVGDICPQGLVLRLDLFKHFQRIGFLHHTRSPTMVTLPRKEPTPTANPEIRITSGTTPCVEEKQTGCQTPPARTMLARTQRAVSEPARSEARICELRKPTVRN